jgi:hypothetical protein
MFAVKYPFGGHPADLGRANAETGTRMPATHANATMATAMVAIVHSLGRQPNVYD